MIWRWALGAILTASAWSAQAADEPAAQPYAALAAADARLATIAERLQSANADLCRQLMPVTGMILHSRDQYGAVPDEWFANGPVEVQQVLPDSPAEQAGLSTGDALISIGGQQIASLPIEVGRPRRDTAFALLAQQPEGMTLALILEREGRELSVNLTPPRGCRAMIEVLTGESNLARADGRVIQVSGDFVTGLSESDLAVLVAHELAHIALEHRRRLDEAGAQQGLSGFFGRNRRLARQAEIEADLLSPHILANAGYDPQSVVLFWRSPQGRRAGGGAFHSPIYPSPTARARLIEQEIEQYLRRAEQPSIPSHLLGGRDEPMIGNFTNYAGRE